MNEDPKDTSKKLDLFDPQKKMTDESTESILHTGWLQDEQWSIQIDSNRTEHISGRGILIAGGGCGGSSGDGGGDGVPSCKSCGSCGGN